MAICDFCLHARPGCNCTVFDTYRDQPITEVCVSKWHEIFPSVVLIVQMSLSYLETNGEESVIRPWFWITWIFVGPVLQCLSGEWFVYTAVRVPLLIVSISVSSYMLMLTFVRRTEPKYKPKDYSLNSCSNTPSEFASRRTCPVFLPMNPLLKSHWMRSVNRLRHLRAKI